MKRRGFTLIELLVVISIIALLMAVLIPALRAAKAAATGSVCLSNVHSLSVAWVTYAFDHDGKLVGGYGDGSRNKPGEWVQCPQNENGDYVGVDSTAVGAASLENKKRGIERGALFPYVKDIKTYHCPGDKRYKKPPADPSVGGTCGGYRSYSIIGGMNGSLFFDSMKGRYHPCRAYTEIRAPAEKYVFVEDADPRGFNRGSWVLDITRPMWEDPPARWHYNKSNLGFADGHAEMHFWKDKRTIAMINETAWKPDGKQQSRNHPGNKDLEYMQKHYFVLRGGEQ